MGGTVGLKKRFTLKEQERAARELLMPDITQHKKSGFRIPIPKRRYDQSNNIVSWHIIGKDRDYSVSQERVIALLENKEADNIEKVALYGVLAVCINNMEKPK
jgi:hypothetical protein